MKILIVTTRFPYALGKPDSFTVYHLVKHLSQRHRLAVASLIEDEQERGARDDLEQYCDRLLTVPHSPLRGKLNVVAKALNLRPMQVNYFSRRQLSSAVHGLVAKFRPDLVYCHLMRAAPYGVSCQIPKVLALQISHILNYSRLLDHSMDWRKRILYSLELALVRRYEPAIARRFSRCLMISNFDRRAIDPLETMDNVFYSPHGVDTDYFSRRQTPGNEDPEPFTIIFPADFGPATNRDAAQWLLTEILPRIRIRVPEVRLILAGRNPPADLVAAATRDVRTEITGFVDDIRVYYKRATVLVDPVRACAGLQNKILTGLAMEVPVVATFAANEGIQARENTDLLLAGSENPQGIADHVVTLLEQPKMRRRLAENGRRFVTSRWTWEYHFSRLEEMFVDLVGEGTAVPTGV